jgi:hypothetical protein
MTAVCYLWIGDEEPSHMTNWLGYLRSRTRQYTTDSRIP